MGNMANSVGKNCFLAVALFIFSLSLFALSVADFRSTLYPVGPGAQNDLAEVEQLIDDLSPGQVDLGSAEVIGLRLDHLALLHPLSRRVHMLAHLLARAAGDPVGAELALNRLLTARPRAPSTYYARGIWFVERGRAREALANFETSLGFGQKELIGIFDICFRIFGGRFASFERIIPDDDPTRESVARLLSEKGLFEESLELYRECIENQPERADLYHRVAVCHFQRGAYEASLAAADQALALEPASRSYILHQGECRLVLGLLEEALENCRRLVAGDPLDKRGYLLLARCHTANGNERLVLQAYRDGLYRTVEKALFHRLLGDCHRFAGRLAEAQLEYRAALEAHPSAKEKQQTFFGLGLCLERAGRRKEAAAVLRQALDAGEGRLPWLDENVSKALKRIETI